MTKQDEIRIRRGLDDNEQRVFRVSKRGDDGVSRTRTVPLDDELERKLREIEPGPTDPPEAGTGPLLGFVVEACTRRWWVAARADHEALAAVMTHEFEQGPVMWRGFLDEMSSGLVVVAITDATALAATVQTQRADGVFEDETLASYLGCESHPHVIGCHG